MGNVSFQNGSKYAETVSDQKPLPTAAGHRLAAPLVCSFDAGHTSSNVVIVPSGYRLARVQASNTWLEREVKVMGSIDAYGSYMDANDMAGDAISMLVKPAALCYVAPIEGAMIGASPQIVLKIDVAQVEAQQLKLWFVAV